MDLPASPQITQIQAVPEQFTRWGPAFARSIAVLCLAVVFSACSLFGSGDAAPAPAPGTRAERIQELRNAIAGDHANLEDLITQPREEGAPEIHLNPELRTIADRLGENERELARLVALAREDAR
jgi:hypothetical protein